MKATDGRAAPTAILPIFPEDAPLAWAAICGAVSAGSRWEWMTLGRVLIAIVLAEFIFRWSAWLISQGNLQVKQPPSSTTASLRYAVPDSQAQRLSRVFAKLRALWVLPRGLWMRTLVFFFLAGLLLAYGLGTPGIWVGILGLVIAPLSGVWLKKRPGAAQVWSPLTWMTLAWMLGTLAAGGAAGWFMAAAPVFGAAASGLAALRGGKAWGRALALAGLTAPAAILIAHRLMLPAAAALFVAAPAYVLALRVEGTSERRARALQPLLWTSMAVAALALGWWI